MDFANKDERRRVVRISLWRKRCGKFLPTVFCESRGKVRFGAKGFRPGSSHHASVRRALESHNSSLYDCVEQMKMLVEARLTRQERFADNPLLARALSRANLLT